MGVVRSGNERSLLVEGIMHESTFDEELWSGLSQVSFSAESGGMQIGVAVGGLSYELVSPC